MISSQRQVSERALRQRTRSSVNNRAPVSSEEAVIPYDHAAAFELSGRPGNTVQDVISVSSDGVFVAVAIGYGFEEQRSRAISFDVRRRPGDLTLGSLPLTALIEGFRINPRYAPLVLSNAPGRVFSEEILQLDNTLERIKPPEDISFFFNIVDSGTGREFQDQPTHNLASLGKSNGERPFRMLAQPLTFVPRSTLRLQVTERSEGVRGTLFIVLYGYKILGATRCPEPVVRNWRVSPRGCAVEAFGDAGARAIPFDYVTSFSLTGTSGNLISDEISVNVESGFVATSIGYGLAVQERNVALEFERRDEIIDPVLRRRLNRLAVNAPVNLANLPLRLFPTATLLDGIRIRPNFLRVALGNNGTLADALPGELANKVFERLNRPDDVSFRYAIFDGGRGHELQNRRINNIAGLGIANGDRPFKQLARPMSFLPRSTIRVEVEERFGRGDLFIAFQGYKLLGGRKQG